MLERVNGLWELPGLGVGGAEEVPGVGIVRVNFGDAAEGVNRNLRVIGIPIQQSKIEPGVGIVRAGLGGFFQQLLCRIDAGEIELRDAFVEASDFELGVEEGGLLEVLESLLKKLLIHVSGAEIVQAGSFPNRIGWFRGAKVLSSYCEDAEHRHQNCGANQCNS